VDGAARVLIDPSGLAVGERPSVLGVAPDRVREALASGRFIFERPIVIGDATRQAYLPIARQGDAWGVLCLEMADPLPQVLLGLRRPFAFALAGAAASATALALALVAALRLRDQSRRRVQQVESLATAGKLAAGIAHEVKNPLGMILASAQLLQRSPGLAPADRRLLGEIAEEVSRADDQLDGFLDLVREMPLKIARFDLREVVRACSELAQAQARRLRLGVSFALPDAEVPVAGDRRRIRQALVNLVLNALEATPAGGTVTVTVSSSAELATIAVADSGGGIPAALQARLFEPFVTSKPHGTGLGLSTARRIIARHRGSLRLVATGPAGTTFAIDLPLAGPA
jgi:signal transduction histidine kinase